MTSTTDAAGHPDVDEISSLTEGVLSPSRGAAIRQHLNGCADCSETYAALEEVRGLLVTFPAPPPMPIDIAERIDAALATEALLAATTRSPSPQEAEEAEETPTGSPGAVDTSGSQVASDASYESERRSGQRIGAHVSRETCGLDVPAPPGTRPPGHSRAATGPGRADRGRSASRRRTITLGAVFTAVVIGVGSVLLQMVGSSTSGGPSGASTVRPSDARNAFSSRSLEGQVSTLLRKHPDPAQTQKESGSTTPTPSLDMGSKDSTGSVGAPKTATPLERPDIAMDVPDCVLRGIGRNEAPIVAERGTFDGTDAFLVVFPHATDQSKVSAYVVDATCAEKPLAPAGTILLTHAYPRR